ncbi:MAG: chromosomal replication initiator protein DnaA [Phycisphaeraceae bacterium]
MTKLTNALWRDIMQFLHHHHAPICRQWFNQLEPLELESGVLKVLTPNSVQRNYLQRKCLDQFTEAAQSVTGALVVVRFVTAEQAPARVPKRTMTASAHARRGRDGGDGGSTVGTAVSDAPNAGGNSTEFLFDPVDISPDYSFDNFVCGPCNRLANAASVAVANQPGTEYNPLFIYGGVGMGKTHLLQAICQSLLHGRADLRICYLSCDAFMNHFLECVQNSMMNQFRQHYRQIDVLMLDDIHFLARRERSQEEFFHTFNALYQSNRQIVLSSDSPPSEIPQLEERLASRFQWGLVANVTRPCYETRVAIIQSKAKLRGLEIAEEVVHYIANRVDTNSRELEGALTTVQGHAALQNRTIDLTLAREALGGPANDSRPGQVTLQNIIDFVTSFYNVKLSELQSKRRYKSITQPRQVCMWLARKHTRFSLEEVGGYFGGRDHTTVMHSIKTVGQRMTAESAFAREVEQIEQQICGQR